MSGSMFQPPTFGQAPTLPGPAQNNLAMFGQAASQPPAQQPPMFGGQSLFNAAPQQLASFNSLPQQPMAAPAQQPQMDYSALFQALAQHPAFQQMMQAPQAAQGVPAAASFQPQMPAPQASPIPSVQQMLAPPAPPPAPAGSGAVPPTGYATTYPMDQWIIDQARAAGLPTATNGIPWAAPGSPEDHSAGIKPWLVDNSSGAQEGGN